ncbi:MAG: ribonuclease III [Parcubacteria group bacterium Gr01-1014_70]|nr:MAG: ribonuclease III [Parcubacteria group bacterium Gr01-1014_70]
MQKKHWELLDVEKRLGVSFHNKELLREALTHRSYVNEDPSWPVGHNERLEFLGDAVLELVMTEFLFGKFPASPEGELTSLRAAMVNTDMLSRRASEIGLNEALLLSRGEAKDTGRARQYLLANAFEALVGALYLDCGYEAAKEFLARVLFPQIDYIVQNRLWKDPKSLFQEEAQERVSITPNYKVLNEWGPDHAKHFVIGVFLNDEKIAEGEGDSKQEAETAAAAAGLKAKNWGGEF